MATQLKKSTPLTPNLHVLATYNKIKKKQMKKLKNKQI